MTKGGITTKQYTQDWRCYQGAAKHMLRFYACYPDISVDRMTEPSHRAWVACHTALEEFSETDRETVLRWFRTGWKQKPAPSGVADPDEATVITRAIRAVTIRSGLADE